jgi:Ran-binding protein 3
LPTEPVSSGEEGEHHVFQQRMKLFLLEGTEWKERGLGNLRLNVADDKSYARLLMRAEGVLRLVLNIRLYPSIKLEAVGDKAARFVAPHPDKPKELATFLVRAGRPEQIKELIAAVDQNKNMSSTNGNGSKKD